MILHFREQRDQGIEQDSILVRVILVKGRCHNGYDEVEHKDHVDHQEYDEIQVVDLFIKIFVSIKW